MMDYAVIMAGGVGTRFWPLSRKSKPKQFLPIVSDKTMLEETVERILPLFPYERIYTVANPEFSNEIYKLIPNLPEKNLIIEPSAKNTAPCLILATAMIYIDFPEATIVALPADHFIQDRKRLLEILRYSLKMAKSGEYLITIGIPPSFPATGYGYIHYSKKAPLQINGEKFYKVEEFKEKPDLNKAREYISSGEFLWNSGVFIWQAKTFFKKLKTYTPKLYNIYLRLADSLKAHKRKEAEKFFSEFPSISIDYALMEKAKEILVVKGDFGWSDVGSWSTLSEIWPKDNTGNIAKGKIITIDSSDCIVYNPNALTTLVGVKDLIIINSNNALLICNKKLDQKVKDLVNKIDNENLKEYL